MEKRKEERIKNNNDSDNKMHHNLSQNWQNQILNFPIPRKRNYIDQTNGRINRRRFHHNRDQWRISFSVLFAQGRSKPIADDDQLDDDKKGEKHIDSNGERPVGKGKGESEVCPEVGTG